MPSLPHPPRPAAETAQRPSRPYPSWKVRGALIATGVALSFAAGVAVSKRLSETAVAGRQPPPSPPVEEPTPEVSEKTDDAPPLPSPTPFPSSISEVATPWPAAVAALKVRLAFMEGRPFDRDLALLMAVAAFSPRLHKTSLALRPWAGGVMVMGRRALAVAFGEALRLASVKPEGKAAQPVADENGDGGEKGFSYLRGLIRITKVAPTTPDGVFIGGVPSDDALDAVGRATRAIEEGDLAEAIGHVSALPEARREHFAAWLMEAHKHLAFERALTGLEAAIGDALASAP